MKIKEFAEEKGLAYQSVYKRLKEVGTSIAAITDKKHNLTPEGLQLLNKLYGEEQKEDQIKESENSRIGELDKVIQELRNQIEDLKMERDKWAEAARQAQQTAQQAQALHMANLKALPEPAKKEPIIRRIINRIKGKPN